LDGTGDLLHARRSGVGVHHRPDRVRGIDNRERAASDDAPQNFRHRSSPLWRPRIFWIPGTVHAPPPASRAFGGIRARNMPKVLTGCNTPSEAASYRCNMPADTSLGAVGSAHCSVCRRVSELFAGGEGPLGGRAGSRDCSPGNIQYTNSEVAHAARMLVSETGATGQGTSGARRASCALVWGKRITG
jgi:hypothetical protein